MAIMSSFLYMFQQPEPKRIHYLKWSRKAMDVPMVEDSPLLMCTMPIIFPFLPNLANNPRCN